MKFPLYTSALLLSAAAVSGQIIIQDDFSGPAEALDGRTPSLFDNGNAWNGNADWTTNGSTVVLAEATANGNRSNYIEFTPVAGNIYRLSADINVNANAVNDWFSLSFYDNAVAPSTSTSFTANDVAAMLVRSTGAAQSFIDNDGAAGGAATTAVHTSETFLTSAGTLAMTLDTTQANWSIAFSMNGNEYRSGILGANETIDGVLFGSNGSSFGTIDNFTLQVIPEASTYAFIGGVLTLGFVVLRHRRS